MRIGLFLTNQQPRGSDQVRALDEQLRLLRAAREGGWDGIFAGHHHLPDGVSHIQPLPFLARLAADSGDMDVGITILLLALHNPLAVAEEYASLDAVCGGRLIFGVGLGYRDVEYEAFGIGRSGRLARFNAHLDIVRRLWEGETVDADLPWCRLDGARLTFPPVQRPRPPIWMAANSDAAVRRAATDADAWIINPHATVGTIRRQIDLYDACRHEAGLGDPPSRPVLREVFCAPDRRTALELAGPSLSEKYRTYASWGQDQVMPDRDRFDAALDELAADRFVIGSPDDCLQALLPWRDELGCDRMIIRTHWSGMPVESAEQSIRLLSEHVLPVLRETQKRRNPAR